MPLPIDWQPAQSLPPHVHGSPPSYPGTRYRSARLTTRSALQCVMEVVTALSTPLLQCCQDCMTSVVIIY